MVPPNRAQGAVELQVDVDGDGKSDNTIAVEDGMQGETLAPMLMKAPGGEKWGWGISLMIGFIGLAGFGIAGVLSIEMLKFGLILFFIPLYTKLRNKNILDLYVRGQIYGYLMANPGEHYNSIKHQK